MINTHFPEFYQSISKKCFVKLVFMEDEILSSLDVFFTALINLLINPEINQHMLFCIAKGISYASQTMFCCKYHTF